MAVLVEIDRNHPLIDDLLVHERDLPLGALRNVIEYFAVQGGHRRGRTEHDQDLVLACADRDLFQGPVGQDVALLVLLGGARSQRGTGEGRGENEAEAATARFDGTEREAPGALYSRIGHSGACPFLLHRAGR